MCHMSSFPMSLPFKLVRQDQPSLKMQRRGHGGVVAPLLIPVPMALADRV